MDMDAAPTRCKKRGCPHFVRGHVHHRLCATPDIDLAKLGKKQTAASKRYDDRRGSSAKRGYGGRWQKTRVGFLAKHPLCVFCERIGKVVEATVVDHIKPHKGDMNLFWQRHNWQPLCKHHHDLDKFKIETAWLKGLLSDTALIGIGVKISMPS